MRKIEWSAAFKKDIRREAKGKNLAALNAVLPDILHALANDLPMSVKYYDHKLTGEFNREETAAYVKRHLERVKCPREIFTESALQMIHDYSGGRARKVNKVSYASLMAAASQKNN
jgi:mRNA-degrading endonuclease YafQ of YafQ-DinJ toxin-antitoxin module